MAVPKARWTPQDADTKGTYDTYWKKTHGTSVSPDEQFYEIVFWEGEHQTGKDTYNDGSDVKVSSLFKHDINGVKKIKTSDGKYLSKAEFASVVKGWVDSSFNALNLSVRLTARSYTDKNGNTVYYKDTTDANYLKSYGAGAENIIGREKDLGAFVFVGKNVLSLGNMEQKNASYIICAMHWNGDTISISVTHNYFWHELAHTFGLWHEAQEIKTSKVNYFNPYIGKMPIVTGFLYKLPNDYTAYLHALLEDKVCFMDVLYNTSSDYYVAKIYGYVDKSYNSGTWTAKNSKINYTFINGNKLSVSVNALFNGNIHTNAEVLLYDTHQKEIMYRMPVDINGYFEFRLRIVPPSSLASLKILLISEHFYRRLIYQERDDTTKDWKDIEASIKPSGGYFYYGVTEVPEITAGTKDYPISNLTFNKSVETFNDIESDAGVYLEYNTSFGSSVYVEYSSTKRYFECIKSHKSSLWNKPLKDETSRWYWRETIKTNNNKWMADKDYIGKYKNEVTINIKLQEYNKANNLAVCGIDKFPK